MVTSVLFAILLLVFATPSHAANVMPRTPTNCSVGSGTSINCTVSSGVQAGDRVVLLFRGNTPTAAPTGYTSWITFGGSGGWFIYDKVAVGGDAGATVTINWTGSAAANLFIWPSYSFDGTTPVRDTTNTAGFGSGSSQLAPSVTPSVTGDGILVMANCTTTSINSISNVASPLLTGCVGSGWFGDETSSAPVAMPLFTASGNAAWNVLTVSLQPASASTSAILIGVGPAVGGSGNSIALGPAANTTNGDLEFAIWGLNSSNPVIVPPAGWTIVGSLLTNANAVCSNTSALAIYTHVKAGADPSPWTFTNTNTGNGNGGVILTFGNVSGVDVSATLNVNQKNNLVWSRIDPTASDELLLRVLYTPAFGGNNPTVPTNFISLWNGHNVSANSSGQALYSDASQNGYATMAGDQTACSELAFTLGLQSTNTPTHTTANQRVDQLGMMLLSPFGAPIPPPSCGGCGTGVQAP